MIGDSYLRGVAQLALASMLTFAGCGKSGTHQSEKQMSVDLGGRVNLELVWCPPGSFMMGSPEGEEGRQDNETQHRVTLTKGFWMGKYEVTQRQWEAVMGNDSFRKTNAGPGAPVEKVSWNDCQEFVRRVNARVPDGGFRLPTEAEWEYACRAETTTSYSFGEKPAQLHQFGNYCDRSYTGAVHWKGLTYSDGFDKAAPAGSYSPNEWDIYDMHGNVWEWCLDWIGDYPSGAVTDPKGAASGYQRVARGGSWYSSSKYCRSANRIIDWPISWISFTGFRIARSQ